MNAKHALSLILALIMTASIFIPVVDAAESRGIDLSATVKEPQPEIAISVDTDHIDFGELFPGEISASYPVAVTNVGLRPVDATIGVEDSGPEAIFVPGIIVNDNAWGEYSSLLVSDGSDSFDVALQVPETVTTRGGISGSMTVWAEARSNIYSTAMGNTNPGAPDAGIPGFVGPDGDGVILTQRLSGAIPSNNIVNPIFTAWASKVIDFSPATATGTQSSTAAASNALGPVTGSNMHIVSLGDLDQTQIAAGQLPGSITLGFDVAITDGPGPDFAAFENGFISAGGAGVAGQIFAELGYVEVSTDGVTFVRFPSVSLASGDVGGYGTVDPTTVYNLVGKHVNAYGDSWGTPFDLSDLAQSSAVLNGSVDLNNINYVRIVDIPGSGDFKDSLGNPIYDAWPTWGTGGLDFEALGVINSHAKQISAGFSASPLTGEVPLTVQFTDHSVNATSWAWDFNNDGIVDSTEQNPSWMYANPGTYTVKLTVTNSAGSDFEVKKNFITVSSPPGTFTYTSDGSSVTITGYAGSGGDVIIPGTIDNLPVTGIGNSAFSGKTAVTSVSIPNSVITIGTSVFLNCAGLTTVTIGSGVTSFNTNIFTGCTALMDIIVDAANSAYTSVDGVVYDKAVTTIVYCPLSKTSVTIPDTVASIPNSAFQSHTALASIVIPNSVTTIGLGAFQDCTALTSIMIPDSVTSIGANAFSASGLTTLTIPNSVTSIGNGAFQRCAALTSVTIGSDVTTIGTRAFYGCVALTSVTIPNNVTSIGANAFQGCTALTSVTIPNNVTSIGTQAFSGCTALITVNIGSGVTGITASPFTQCIALTAINIDADNNAYTSIDGVVYNKAVTALVICPAGKTGAVTIPDSVTSIGTSAFSNCNKLTSVSIGGGITSIPSNAFSSCTALTAINIDADNSALISVDGVVYSKDGKTLVVCPTGKTGSFVIPDGVTTIGNYAFNNCNQLTSVNIGSGVTSIGTQAFSGCTALTTLTIPNSVTSLGVNVFSGCTGLITVTLGNGVTSIPSAAFYECTALTSVTIPDSVTAINARAFESCTALTSVTIPDSVTAINARAFESCNNLTAINVDSANTVFSSIDGVVYNKTVTSLVYCPLGKTSLTIPDTVTSIPNNAFQNYKALTSVTIPDSVTSIGNYAFAGCSALVSVIIPDSATTLGTYAFQDCVVLNSVTIGSGVTNIRDFAFQGCTALTSITIPNSVTSIGANAFSGCTALTSVAIPDNVTTIGARAFDGCTALTTLTIPNSVTSIGANAFSGCTALTTLTIPNSVTSIGNGAFQRCAALTSVTIGSDVTTIGTRAFYGCVALTSVTIPNNVTSIGTQAFNGCTALVSMTFEGNAPGTVGSNWAQGCTNLVVYYHEGATGFTTPTWQGVPCYQLVLQQNWASFQGGSYHDGVTANDGPITSASLSWVSEQMSTDGYSGIDHAPIVADGKVFVIDRKGYVYAYYVENGTKAWENKALGRGTSTSQLSTPAYHDGVLYVAVVHDTSATATRGVSVYALDADDGSTLWQRVRIATGYCQPNTPIIYDDGRICFGVWYSSGSNHRYFCLNAADGTSVWERTSATGRGYYWAGAAVIGDYLVYGDDAGNITSVNKLTGATVQDMNVNAIFGIPSAMIRSSVSYSEETHRIYFTTMNGYCLALGFNAEDGTFDTEDKWAVQIGTKSTSTPAVHNGKVYVGIGDFNANDDNKLFCLNEADGSVVWSFVANGGVQSSPVISLNDDGQVYIYFTSNAANGRAYCVDANGELKWFYEPESDKVQYTLHGVAIYDDKVFFGNDLGYLFALVGE